MSDVKIVAITSPVGIEGVSTAEDFIAYCARVSNPTNQMNSKTSPKLLKYLITNKHFSPFEMVSVTISITTTRDIGRQILRHRSFSFQEFSQRYAAVDTKSFEIRDARLQDNKNRQNSIESDDEKLQNAWEEMQLDVQNICAAHYRNALSMGIAKEQARAVLPEGMTKTTMYMSGTLRSFLHYVALRAGNGTQLEHRVIAEQCIVELKKYFPSLSDMIDEMVSEGNHTLNRDEIKGIINQHLKYTIEANTKSNIFPHHTGNWYEPYKVTMK